VFEKWSEPRTGAAAKRAEKVLDGLFEHPARLDTTFQPEYSSALRLRFTALANCEIMIDDADENSYS
jgi:hypothetical protein